jgi:plastocyanin
MGDLTPVRALVTTVGVLVCATAISVGGPMPAGAAGADARVAAKDDVFTAQDVSVSPGGTVTWTNNGKNNHNVFADDGSFQSKNLPPGATFSVTFAKQGRFTYFCSLHGDRGGKGMSGTVLVGLSASEYSSTSATRTYPSTPPVRPAGGRTLHVPADFSTIQAAVDASHPGDLVLVAPGTYHEAVTVTTANITIRGEDRNRVILEGGLDPHYQNGVAVFGADGVAVENMTARHYQLNGFYWRSVWGYRGSYLTAYDDGDYGVYAFDSGVGQFDHSYAGGHPDSGFYIGQCDPCNALITNVVSENNALGYSGTNASGNLVIRDSEWRDNMGGIVPNTLDSEALPPQHSITIVGNWVHDNHNRKAPANPTTYNGFGQGILLGGGNDNEVAYNVVEGHTYAGIIATPNLDKSVWIGHGNRVHDNTVSGSGVADIALMAPAGTGNCFAGNRFKSSLPPAIETVYGCGSPGSGVGGGDVGLLMNTLGFFARSTGDYPHGDWRTQPEPPAQTTMPVELMGDPAPAGPGAPVQPAAQVARAATSYRADARPAAAVASISRVDEPLAAVSGSRPLAGGRGLGGAFYTLFGYALPPLFVIALLLRLTRATRRPWLTGRRVLLGLPALYIAACLLVSAGGYLN